MEIVPLVILESSIWFAEPLVLQLEQIDEGHEIVISVNPIRDPPGIWQYVMRRHPAALDQLITCAHRKGKVR